VIEIDSDRELYTKHGLHLNVKGKESVVGKIVNVINDVIRVKITNPLIMKWKVKETEDKGKEHTEELEESVGSEDIKDQDKGNRKPENPLETKDSSDLDKGKGELEKLQGRKDIRDPDKGNRGLEEPQGIKGRNDSVKENRGQEEPQETKDASDTDKTNSELGGLLGAKDVGNPKKGNREGTMENREITNTQELEEPQGTEDTSDSDRKKSTRNITTGRGNE
jgi:hypothetical protein